MSDRLKYTLLLGLVVTALVMAFAAVLWGDPATTRPAPHDDAPTLQKRLNRNDVVVTLAADYQTATPVILTNVHGLTVFAYGASITAAPTQTTGDVNGNGDTLQLTNCSNVNIFGLAFNGNRNNRGGFSPNPVTVRLTGCSDIRFRDCSFTSDVCDALYLCAGYQPKTADLACRRVTVDSCRFNDPGRNCISIIGAAWCSVVNCDLADAVTSAPFAGIDIEANAGDPDGINHHLTISNNRVRNVRCAVQIVGVTSPTGIVITGNQIDSTRGDGIYNEAAGTLITGNNITNCPVNAVGISSPAPATVQHVGNNATVWPK